MTKNSPYVDLEIRIDKLEKTAAATQGRYPVELTLDDDRVFEEAYLSTDILPWRPGADPTEEGDRLFRWFLGDDRLQRQWERVRGQALQRRIRLRIDRDAPELHVLPWEVLRDTLTGTLADTLAANADTPFSRYLAGAWELVAAINQYPIRLLVAVANPQNLAEYSLSPIDVAEETAILNAAFSDLDPDRLDITFLEQPLTLNNLEAELRRRQPHLVHLIGHGQYHARREEALLYLADAENRVALVSATDLADMLHRSSHSPHLIFLASCQSATRSPADAFRGLAPSLIEAGVPAVVAMQDRVTVETARTFSRTFYQQLLRHGQVDLACNEARSSLLTSRLPGSQIPVLFSRLLDNQLFVPPAPSVSRHRRYLPWAVAGLVLVIALVAATLIYRPAPVPMPGEFNIAITQFGRLDEAGRMQESENGTRLSRWLFEGLQAEIDQQQGLALADKVEVWHDSRRDTDQNITFGIMAGETPAARRNSALELAEAIGAHIVIYGHLAGQDNSAKLNLEFYLSPLVNDETGVIVGPHRLGKPLTIPATLDGNNDPVANIFVSEQLEARAGALFWLTMGLTQHILGQTERALETFLQAQEALSDWAETDGKEILYFFTGREQLTLGQSEAAADSFRRALALDPDYLRAEVALGSTYLQQTFAITQAVDRLREPSVLAQAQTHHERGVELAAQTEDAVLKAVAHISLAKTYRVSGETYYALSDYAQAEDFFNLALAEAEKALLLLNDSPQYRLLAQSYEVQEMAHLQQAVIRHAQGDTVARDAHLVQAETARDDCAAQGEKSPLDEFLREKVIEQSCRRAYTLTVEFLQLQQGE